MKKKTVTIKAWAIFNTYPRKIKKPIEPGISDAKISGDEGHCCGGGSTNAMGIYRTEQEAKWNLSTHDYGIMVEKIIPCKITYQLINPL